jgi:hypothetical protein
VSRGRGGSRLAVAWSVSAFLAVAVLAAADDVLRHDLGQLAAAVLIGAGGYVAGRRRRRISWPGRVPDPERHELVELAELRRQVAELEDAAGRPLAAITATYRHLQRRYDTPARRP